jgi:alcohol dehydrogenase class IV
MRQFLTKLKIKVAKYPIIESFEGNYCSNNIGILLKNKSKSNALIVTEKEVMKKEQSDRLIKILRLNKIDYIIHNGVSQLTDIKSIDEGYKIYKEHKCDCIIGLGGDSSIDCAKIIGARLVNKKTVKRMKGVFKIKKEIPFLVAIPIIPESGAESDITAHIIDEKTKESFYIFDSNILPRAVFLDPLLIGDIASTKSAIGIMNALAKAIEAFIGNNNHYYSEGYALKSIEIIFRLGEKYILDDNNIELSREILLASNYAGRAASRTTRGYSHVIAYNLSLLYGIRYDKALAITLPHLMEEVKDKSYKRLALIAKNTNISYKVAGDKELADLVIDYIRELNYKLEIPEYVPVLRKRDILYLAEKIEKESNPELLVSKVLFRNDFVRILENMLGVE